MLLRFRRFLPLAILLLLAPSGASALAEEWTYGFQVRLHLRLPDGKEETKIVDDFKFVYYERRFVNKPAGFGKPGKLEVKDLPKEKKFLQNEQGKKLKFKKLSRLRLEYQPVEGGQQLVLIASFIKKKHPEITWPAASLRNSSVARFPNFLGTYQGKVLEIPLPPLGAVDTPPQELLTLVEFRFEGQKKHRDRF
jgi:hypothetical protein